MQRAFLPLNEFTLGTRTRITLLHPAKGDLTVKPGERISFEVKLTGVVPRINTPQEARLLYRHQSDHSWTTLVLDDRESNGLTHPDGIWTVVMESDRVQNGFTYKIVAGDAETPEYQVIVQSLPGYANPQAEMEYHYPAYLHMADRKVAFPNDQEVFPRIKGPAGTEVTMVVRTNRELHSGKLEVKYADSVKDIPGTVLEKDAKAFSVKFALETSGQFYIRFTTKAGESNSDNSAYQLQVIPDRPPFVELTKPGKDTKLPVNGTLQLEGFINDDYGIKLVFLRLEVQRGSSSLKTPLQSKRYRPGKSFEFEDGTFADRLDYRDFVVLSQLKMPIGLTTSLSEGDVLYYWLEATDNCDYPEGQKNVGTSKIFKVEVTDKLNGDKAGDLQDQENKQREIQNQAERNQQDHEKRQDQNLKQQEIDRKQKQQQQQNQPNEPDPTRADDQEKRDRDLNQQLKELIDKEKQARSNDNNNQGTEKGPGSQGADQPGQGEKKDWTEKDVASLKEMQKNDGPLSDMAQRELKDAAKGAKTEEVRQAAKDALKANEPQPQKDLSPQQIDKLKDMLKDEGQPGQAAAQALDKAAKESKNTDTKQAAGEALKDAKPGQLDPAQKKEITEKDIAKFKEMLDKDPALKELAKEELKNAAEQAKNDAVKQAAKDALKNAENQARPSPKDVEQLKKLLDDKGRVGQAAKEELEKAAKSADEATSKAAKDALKNTPNNQANNPPPQKQKSPGSQASQPPKKNMTEKDIAQLNEILKDKGPLGDFARQQLKEAIRKANDPDVKKAAEESLKKQGARAEPSAKDIEEFQKILNDKGPLGEMVREELKNLEKQTKNDATRQQIQKALKDAPPPQANQPPKGLTEKDISKMEEMRNKPGAVGEFGQKELEKAAGDPKAGVAGEAARDALKNAQAGKQPTPKDVDKLKDLAKGNSAVAEAAKDKLTEMAQQTGNADTAQAAKNALKDLQPPAQSAPTSQGDLAKADPKRDVTLKQIEELEKDAQKNSLLGETAKRELSEARRLAKNPEARKAAEEALKRLASQKGVEQTKDDVDILKELAKGKGPDAAAALRELNQLADGDKKDKVADAARKALTELDKKAPVHDPIRDATMDDVAAEKKKLNKEGLTSDIAAQKLAEMKNFAKGKDVRKAAKEALDSRDPTKAEPLTPEDIAPLADMAKGKDLNAEAAARELARIFQESTNADVKKAAQDGFAKTNRDTETLQPKENLPPSVADANAARHGSSLSLEQLKHATKLLKDANVPEAQWPQIIKQLEEKIHADSLTKRGDTSKQANTAPQLLTPTNSNSPSIQGTRGQPPPGYRDTYDRWTTGPTSPDGK
jgi:hypothetical protein